MPKIIATKENWVELGYKLFSEDGINGVVVEKMAKVLKVNKSSFYWYFNTKKDFVNEIISFWISLETKSIISKLENNQYHGKEKFEKFIELAFKQEPYLDFIFFLKKYALHDRKIQQLIDEIDTQRIDYTKKIFLEMNIMEEDAVIKASLFYKYLIGYHEMLRYKKQNVNYVEEVKKELFQFIKY